jgi:dTDP-4-dehydrorhamnose 3,5-epimerase
MSAATSTLFESTQTPIQGVRVIQRRPRHDHRGHFMRMFCARELRAAGWVDTVAQVNLSHTHALGAVRGLHYQTSHSAEYKLVSCIAGAVWDVAVDLRLDSPSFMQWHAIRLDAENAQSLLIPKGVAHGFQVLVPHSTLLYMHSCEYAPTMEAGLRADDPTLNIAWPLPFSDWSERDQKLPVIDASFKALVV